MAWLRTKYGSPYDQIHGSLYIEPDGAWRIIAPMDPGPQPWSTGGEMGMWLSRDQGAKWEKVKALTHDSERNHSYARKPLNAHPDFYALWADGDPMKPSKSLIYFTTKDGAVFVLPEKMEGVGERPQRIK